jgi:hypothetical protein
VEVAVEEFLLPKIESGFTRHSRNWLKKWLKIIDHEFLYFEY